MTLLNQTSLCSLIALSLLAGCSTGYTNRQACLDQVQTSYQAASPLPYKISNVSVATQGSRVVVEGVIQAPLTHKSVLATLAAAPEELVAAAKAKATGKSPAPAASEAAATPPVLAASETGATPPVLAAHTVPPGNAAAECTFDGRQLTHFQWLTPTELALLSKAD